MTLLQTSLATLGNGLTLLIVLLLWRDARGLLPARIAIPLFLSSIGYSLALLSGALDLPPLLLKAAVGLNVFSLGLGWLFGRALIEDDFRLGPLEWTVFGGLSALILAADARVFGLEWAGLQVAPRLAFAASIAVMAHMCWIAVAGFRNDLVDSRRIIRGWFLLFVLLSYAVLVGLEIAGAPMTWRGVVYDATTITINVSILLWAARLMPQKVFAEARTEPSVRPVIRPQQTEAYARLVKVMENEKAYREPGLSIGALAERVGLPEHQLRRLINSTLGHRNFAAFLNRYRLDDVRARLADSDTANISVLAVAMDCGYQSLSTFNRAFRAHYGETPSEYRSRALSAAAAATDDTLMTRSAPLLSKSLDS